MFKRLLIFALLLAAALPATEAAAPKKALLSARWQVTPDMSRAQEKGFDIKRSLAVSVFISAFDPETNTEYMDIENPVFNPAHPGTQDIAFWRVTATDGKSEESVKCRLQLNQSPSTKAITGIVLIPLKTPKTGYTYHVAPAGPGQLKGLLLPGYTLVNEAKFLEAPIDSTGLDLDITYVNGNKAVESNVSFKTGKQNTAKLELFYGYDHWTDGERMRLQARAVAEGTYRPTDSEKYLNKIEAEAELLWRKDLNYEKGAMLSALWQFGLATKVRSDQEFDNVEGSLALSNWWALNGKSLQGAADFLCIYGDYPHPAPALLLNLTYGLVQRFADDATTGERHLSDTTNRLGAKLYWSFKLAHGIPLDRLTDKLDRYDVDVIVNAAAAYDFVAAQFIPDVELSLELAPLTLDKSKPSFVLTYKNGKTTSKFENYNALLGGIKLPF